MSFEIQELPDVLRIIILLILGDKRSLDMASLKRRIDRYCKSKAYITLSDVDEALQEMSHESLIVSNNGRISLTDRGLRLGNEWRNLLMRKEPIFEFVAGLTDGSITGLVVILSAHIASMASNIALFAAVLSITAVSMTNFSSFLLGAKTEDYADLFTLKSLIDYSLDDIPDRIERDKSLRLIKQLFTLLSKEISRNNFYSAVISAATTFSAGILPIAVYTTLPTPLNLILSLSIVGLIVGLFLVRY
ncbi:MAG: hypothetical protein QW390_01505, partial [Candidatus Bathyarchaeia archaeon]